MVVHLKLISFLLHIFLLQGNNEGEASSGLASALKSSSDYWYSSLTEVQQRLQQIQEIKKSLQENHDKMQQNILHAQIEVEQASSRLEGVMRNRETLQVK